MAPFPSLELSEVGKARQADGFQGGIEVQANLTGSVGIRAEGEAFAAHPSVPFQDESDRASGFGRLCADRQH